MGFLACLACSALAAASLASSARAQAMLSLIDSWKLFGKYSCVGVPFQPFRRAIGCSLSLSAVGLIDYLPAKLNSFMAPFSKKTRTCAEVR
jgi:hypothetical protein